MKYRVKIKVTGIFTTWVEAEDEDTAEDKALEQFNSGKLFEDHEDVSTEIIDMDDGGN